MITTLCSPKRCSLHLHAKMLMSGASDEGKCLFLKFSCHCSLNNIFDIAVDIYVTNQVEKCKDEVVHGNYIN